MWLRKPVKYITLDGEGSCNKYEKCPTYEELNDIHNKTLKEYCSLLYHVNVVLTYKESTEQYKVSEKYLKEKIKNF